MEELEFYKKWCDIIIDYDISKYKEENILSVCCVDKKFDDSYLLELYKIKEKLKVAFEKKDKTFLERGFKDTNEYCFGSGVYTDSDLNARLRAACGKDLRDFDKKRLDKVRKIEERGYIKTNSEYYQIRNHIDYLEATNGTDEEIIKFDTMISLYEEKIREKMEKQKKKRDRQE